MFSSIPETYAAFVGRTETELKILGLGYNDFHVVVGYKRPRTQSFFTLHYVISGKGVLHYGDRVYDVGAGDVFALPPEKEFCYYPNEEEPWEYVFIEFTGTLAAEYLSGVGFTSAQTVRHCENPSDLLLQFKTCINKAQSGVKITYFEAITLLMRFFQTSLDYESPLACGNNDVAAQAEEFIKTHYADPDLTVSKIASALHFSHSGLCRAFRARTGKTMIAYINELRMNYAEELLLKTDLPATKIAYMSGFSEYTYFLMSFKRSHGATASSFRKRL
ncbi:MAG: AraC family transcriptional regulator [Clostridia bacterium]|nr:AraC family transcriptional regulator [Clostridia bacterium]